MQGIALAISENHSKSSLSACDELTNKIKGAFYDIANRFVYIGFLLAEANDLQTFKDNGYSSIYEYASVELGLKKSSVNNFINVCKTFSSNFSSNGEALPYSMIMKDSYSSFNYSQLVEMLSMNDKQRSLVTPDMTIKQIRLLKKENDNIDTECFQTSGRVCVPTGFYTKVCRDEAIEIFHNVEDDYLINSSRETSGEYYYDKLLSMGYVLCSVGSDFNG